MTAKQTVVLRTAFNDRYLVGDLVINQDGTEVPAADADKIVADAKAVGVSLHRMPPEAETKTEGGKP